MTTIDEVSDKLDTLLGFTHAAFTPQVGSAWKWSDTQSDTDILFADDDYGALITTLILGSAGPLRLVDVAYSVGFADRAGDLDWATFADVLAALDAHGHRDGIAFELHNFVPGATGLVLPSRERLAVLPYPLVRQLTAFRLDMTWESAVTGDRTTKDIHLAPRLDPPLPGRRTTPPPRTKAEVLASRPTRSRAQD